MNALENLDKFDEKFLPCFVVKGSNPQLKAFPMVKCWENCTYGTLVYVLIKLRELKSGKKPGILQVNLVLLYSTYIVDLLL